MSCTLHYGEQEVSSSTSGIYSGGGGGGVGQKILPLLAQVFLSPNLQFLL